jgi:hypothetical protein
MIPVNELNEMLIELKAAVNIRLFDTDVDFIAPSVNPEIKSIVLSPNEAHLIKTLKDKPGVILAVQLAPSDTDVKNEDNYSEHDNELFYILEKVDPGRMSDKEERNHYAKLQLVMQFVKDYLFERGVNGNVCGGNEKVSKPFHTEWEYQVYGGFNGLSVSFKLENFQF